MRKNVKKQAAVLLAAAALGLMTTACGGSKETGGSSTSTTTAAGAETTTAAATEAPEDLPDSAEYTSADGMYKVTLLEGLEQTDMQFQANSSMMGLDGGSSR